MSKEKQAPKAPKPVDPFFAVVAKVYGVPLSGIDAIGNQPYLNKDGRLFLLKQLRTGKAGVKKISVEFIKYSTTLIEPALAKKTILFRDGYEVEAIGEASQDSVGKASIKQTLNMVAETRALNRVIWQAIGADIMEKVQDNLENMKISEEDKRRLIEVGRSSYEEMDRPSAPADMPDDNKKLYDSTIERLDKIGDDIEALESCLTKLPNWPFEVHQKAMLEKRIRGAIARLKKKTPENTGKAGKKKAVPRKPGKKTNKKVKKGNGKNAKNA